MLKGKWLVSRDMIQQLYIQRSLPYDMRSFTCLLTSSLNELVLSVQISNLEVRNVENYMIHPDGLNDIVSGYEIFEIAVCFILAVAWKSSKIAWTSLSSQSAW